MYDYKILILSASYGEGHAQVSRALLNKFIDRGVSEVKMIDLFAEAHPFINAVTRYAYLKSYTVAPSLYGLCYYSTRNGKPGTKLAKLHHSFGIRKIQQIIDEEQPDAVIHTFPMMTMAELRRKTNISIPIFSVVTDFALHRNWIHSEVDKYYAATTEIKNKLVASGFSKQQVKVSGIPIRDAFQMPLDIEKIRKKYQMNPHKKTVLIMAGAYGVTQHVKQICASFLGDEDVQILLVCGKNVGLTEDMAQYFAAYDHIRVLGFVEEIHELMSISNCIVTKAGGITLSEAIAKHLPIFLFRPVPGQEKENAKFLAGKGAAIIVNQAEELVGEVKQLLADEERMKIMQAAITALAKNNAAETVVDDVLQEITDSKLIFEGRRYTS